MTKPAILTFGNLPLTEVVARISLSDRLPLTLAFVGDLYDQVSKEFSLSESMHIEMAPGIPTPPSLDKLPVANLSHRTLSGVTAGVQDRLLRVAWVGSLGSVYPGFQSMWGLMDLLLSSIHKLTDLPKPSVTNMAYQNFVAGVAVEHIGEYLTMPVNFAVSDIQAFELAWTPKHEGVDRRIQLVGASKEGTSGVLLTNVAGARLTDKDDAYSSLVRVHDSTSLSFQQNLTEKARIAWKFNDPNKA